MLKDLGEQYDGDVYVPMTLVKKDSFDRINEPLKQAGIPMKHILLESTYEIVHDRILARGEKEDCWCMQNISLCLENQAAFENVIRIRSTGRSVDELAEEVLRLLG